MPDGDRLSPHAPAASRLACLTTAASVFCLAACALSSVPPQSPEVGTSSRTLPLFGTATASVGAMVALEPVPPPDGEIEWLTSILNNKSNDLPTRNGAAARLLGLDQVEAFEPLAAALRSGESTSMLPVIRAMSDMNPPPQELLDAAVDALRTAPREVFDPLALMLVQYEEAAANLIAALAARAELPVAERLGPIHALGPFRSRTAAVQLIGLLDEDRNEPPEIVAAVTASLQRATGLPYGDNPQAWRDWWAEAHTQPREEWLTKLVKRLSDQLTAAEQQIRRERQATIQIERRLAEAYRDLFPRQTLEEQFRSLAVLLEDPIATVREIATDRINRLLRDSVRIPEELQQKLAGRLRDESPALRLQAARLLDQLNVESLPVQLGAALADEIDAEVTAGFLDILARRPAAASVDAVRPLLADRTNGERAAVVLWEILNLNGVDEPARAELRKVVLTTDRWGEWPTHARLLGRLALTEDLARLEPLLDSGDAAMRQAVAEGLYRQGRMDLLMSRSGDEAVYPFVVRGMADAEASIVALRQLLALRPIENHRNVWHESIIRLASKLPPEELRRADDLLVTVPELPPQVRIDVLGRLESIPADALATELRTTLIVRLAALLLRQDQATRSLELLESLNGATVSAEVRQLRFEAALHSMQFDLAYELQNNPGPWVAILSRMVDRRPELAAAMSDEIFRRFDGELTGELLAELEALRDRLPPAPSPNNGSAGNLSPT